MEKERNALNTGVNKLSIEDVVKAISEAEEHPLVIYRSLSEDNNAILVTKRVNELFEEEPDALDTILALYMYPAIKWGLRGRDIDYIMNRASKGNENIDNLRNMQRIIVDIAGFEPKLLLEERKKYFSACEKLVDLIDNIVVHIGSFPECGEIYSSIAKIIIGEKVDGPSKYLINKHVKSMILLVKQYYGQDIEKLLDEVLSGRVYSNEEMKYVYHNIHLLLKEYTKILWCAKNSDDKALKLLSCGSEQEMLKITTNDSKYSQAYIIVEYIKLINGAIEAVKDFPNGGEEYHKILMTLTNLNPAKTSDRDFAEEIGISTYSYSVKKRRALSILSSILWGCDCDTFVKLLTDLK